MGTKLVLENLQRYTKELEERYPNETAYWHLQKLRNEIERVKNIAYEPVLAIVFAINDSGGDLVKLCKTKESAETHKAAFEKDHNYVSFYIDEIKLD